jgi:hypothetical protein
MSSTFVETSPNTSKSEGFNLIGRLQNEEDHDCWHQKNEEFPNLANFKLEDLTGADYLKLINIRTGKILVKYFLYVITIFDASYFDIIFGFLIL